MADDKTQRALTAVNRPNWGIPLTKVTPTGSVRPCGGLSADLGRVRAPVRDARRVPRVPGGAAMARWLPVPEVRRREGVAGGDGAPRVRRLWPSDLGDGRHDLPGYAHASADLVPGHVVGRQPEDGRERHRLAAGARAGELRDRLDLAA